MSNLAQALCLKNFSYDKALEIELNNDIILIGKGAYPTANSNEQHKDDNKNNITKYLEANKARIFYLAEKHYENLVEVFTDSIIDIVMHASSNPTISLPSSSSPTFSSPFDQSDIYGIERSEIYDGQEDFNGNK